MRANSPVSQCRGFYSAVRRSGRGICSWSGRRYAPGAWPPGLRLRGATPFPMRYYLNVVTFGYTTAFRDWERWESAGIDLCPWLLEYSAAATGVLRREYRLTGTPCSAVPTAVLPTTHAFPGRGAAQYLGKQPGGTATRNFPRSRCQPGTATAPSHAAGVQAVYTHVIVAHTVTA